MRNEEVMSEVRSSDLETGLSSSGNPVEGDTAISSPRIVRAFMPLRRFVGWMPRWRVDLRIGSNFQKGFVFVGLVTRIELVISSQVRYVFMRLPLPVDLDSPSTLS